MADGDHSQALANCMGHLAYRNSFLHDQAAGEEVSSIRQQIVDEYEKGPPTKDTAKLFKLTLERRLKTSFDHQSSWVHRIQQARSRPSRDTSAQQMRQALAAFLGSQSTPTPSVQRNF